MGGTATSIKMVLAAGFVIGLASPVMAQPGLTSPQAPAAAERPQTTTRRYGAEIFAADGLLMAVALGAGRAEPLIALALTGPVIHGLHGRGQASIRSLLLRTLVPVGGAYVGAVACGKDDTEDSFACFGHAAIGFGVGAAVALSIDYFVLARETVTISKVRIQPAVSVTQTASTAGVRLDF